MSGEPCNLSFVPVRTVSQKAGNPAVEKTKAICTTSPIEKICTLRSYIAHSCCHEVPSSVGCNHKTFLERRTRVCGVCMALVVIICTSVALQIIALHKFLELIPVRAVLFKLCFTALPENVQPTDVRLRLRRNSIKVWQQIGFSSESCTPTVGDDIHFIKGDPCVDQTV